MDSSCTFGVHGLQCGSTTKDKHSGKHCEVSMWACHRTTALRQQPPQIAVTRIWQHMPSRTAEFVRASVVCLSEAVTLFQTSIRQQAAVQHRATLLTGLDVVNRVLAVQPRKFILDTANGSAPLSLAAA